MIHRTRSILRPAALVLLAGLVPAYAQAAPPTSPGAVSERLDSFKRDTSSFLDRVFGRDAADDAPVIQAQASPSDLVVRLDRLENQIRQLTGMIEQLQYRNQQLEQQLRKMQEDYEFRFQELAKGNPRAPARPPAGPAAQPPGAPPAAPAGPPRRSDVFDPAENPNAPGVPRTLGAGPTGPAVIPAPGPQAAAPPPPATGPAASDEADAPIGVPDGRPAGAPLDLSTLAGQAAHDPALAPPPSQPPGAQPVPPINGPLPPPPPRNPAGTGAQAMLPPNATPKDEYDLSYGYLLRKDYALAEEGFRDFLQKHPSDRLVAEANYWLGESLFQRQRYRDAAESFLVVSTKFDKSGKAPEALLRLAQSLAALKEREAACATLGEIGRKYPRAPANVKQAVEREQKRGGC